jgi:arginyl-tRNA synthetase
VKINQLVNLYKDGKPFKMSKRSGNFITVKDVIDEIGKDAFRFAILTKKSDTVLDIDFNKMKDNSRDNPLFYVQYAHARAKSILEKAISLGIDIDSSAGISHDIMEQDLPLIKSIASLPKVLLAALSYYEPHRINYYLQDLANHFHHLWSLGMEQKNLRFIVDDNDQATKSRIVLVKATAKAIALGLDLLGIKALDKM